MVSRHLKTVENVIFLSTAKQMFMSFSKWSSIILIFCFSNVHSLVGPIFFHTLAKFMSTDQ